MCIITNIIFIVHHAQRKQARTVPLPRHAVHKKFCIKPDAIPKNLLNRQPDHAKILTIKV